MFDQERLCVRNPVLFELDNVVRTVIRGANLKVVTTHLSLDFRPEMGEEDVTGKVCLELRLWTCLRVWELEATGGTHIDLPHLTSGHWRSHWPLLTRSR